MDTVHMHIDTDIRFGQDESQAVGSCAKQIGSRVLLLSEPIIQDEGIATRIRLELEAKKLKCLVFEDISASSGYSGLQEAVQLATAGKVQLIVAVGGMRTICAGRAVALAAGSGRTLKSILEDERPVATSLPCIEIPSSFRNPLQFSGRVVIDEDVTRNPRVLCMPKGFLKTVIVDPQLTRSLSGKCSAALVLDALLSGIEGYISMTSGFIGKPLLRDGIKHCSESVLSVYNAPEELRPRIKACEGGLLINLGLSFGSQGIGGALVYTMSSLFGVPKSWVASVLAPHVAEYWMPIVPQQLASIAEAMGANVSSLSASEAARQVPQVLRRIIGQVDMPGRLRDLGISFQHAKEAGELAGEMDMIRNCPRFPQPNDILNLIKRAY